MFNVVQWGGDYNAAGVSVVKMDLANFGSSMLTMRVGVEGPGGRFVTAGASVPADGVWRQYAFDLSTATAVDGGTNLGATLGAVTSMRILHNPVAAWRGVEEVADAGFDNIRATNTTVATEAVSFSAVKSLFR